MSFSPIAYTIPNYRDFKNYWLKAYEPGTTTPKPMSFDVVGTVEVAKVELDKDGFPASAGGALVIPYIQGSYDLWAFPTEADADNNDTSNAERFADNITGIISAAKSVIGSYTLAEAKALTGAVIGQIIQITDRCDNQYEYSLNQSGIATSDPLVFLLPTSRHYMSETILEALSFECNFKSVTIKDLASTTVVGEVPSPLFKLTNADLDLPSAGDTDGYTYFIDAKGQRFERVREFNPVGNVIAYTENFADTDLIHIAPTIGVCGFYVYLENGDLSTVAEKERLIKILDYYGFKIILGMSLPETGYEAILDSYNNLYNLKNVVGVGAFDEPEYSAYKTLSWQSDVIDYIKNKTTNSIYCASVGEFGLGAGIQVSEKVDVILLSLYAQNGTYPQEKPRRYANMPELDALGRLPGRVKPIIGVYRDTFSNTANDQEIALHNRKLLECFNNNGDVFAFVFYERDSFGLEDLVKPGGAMRRILADSVGLAKNGKHSTSRYAFYIDHNSNPLVGVSNTSTYVRNGTSLEYIGIDSAKYLDIDFDVEVYPTNWKMTMQDISGNAGNVVNTYSLYGFEGNREVFLNEVHFTPNIDGNPAFKSRNIFNGRSYKKFRIRFDAGANNLDYDGGKARITDFILIGNTND